MGDSVIDRYDIIVVLLLRGFNLSDALFF